MTKNANRLFYADTLRFMSIVAVVLLHNTADYHIGYNAMLPSNWWANVIYYGICRFCVPMFVMLSGMFLLNPKKEVNLRQLFAERIPKLLLPLFFWSMVYVVIDVYNTDAKWGGFHLGTTINQFLQGPVIYHFWFLYMMVGIYLIYPILHLFVKSAERKHVEYYLLVWLIANCLFGVAEVAFDWKIGIELKDFTGYAGYFILGYYLNTYPFSKKITALLYGLMVVGFLLSAIIFPCIFKVTHFSNGPEIMESDTTIDVVMMATGLFVWLKNKVSALPGKGILYNIISEGSKESYALYLVHVIVLHSLFEGGALLESHFANQSAWYTVPIRATGTLVLSYLLVKLVRLVPFLNKTLG
ncbi:acyltransferase [Parasediminibacterium sp. JCM 36343]|uniref:acyltransferase n=1 Tax=Parasediminibacterium sp. JCM 36343 TaxID=3374279 RepID=UPI00397AB12E